MKIEPDEDKISIKDEITSFDEDGCEKENQGPQVLNLIAITLIPHYFLLQTTYQAMVISLELSCLISNVRAVLSAEEILLSHFQTLQERGVGTQDLERGLSPPEHLM